MQQRHGGFGQILTSAATGLAIATLLSAVAIGGLKPREQSASRWGILAALIGLVGGGVVGLVSSGSSRKAPRQTQNVQPELPEADLLDPSASPTWQGWRNFIVVRKVKESEEITSFYLKPQDPGTLPAFLPGQFLTLKLEIPGQPQPVIRTYSLSSFPEPLSHYRISVKRELAPEGSELPPGIGSNFLHDQVQVGTLLAVKPPNGKFILDVQQVRPAVLISNGVGITPMIAMAVACCRQNPNRQVWFVHGAKNGNFHAFGDEIMALAEGFPNLRVHIVYSRPHPEDTGHYHSTGYVSAELLQQLVDQNSEFFLCGSPAFMQSLRTGLQTWGVPDSQVFYESFSRPLAKPGTAKTGTSPLGIVAQGLEQAQVVFSQSQQTHPWTTADGTLLEFAEAHGIEPPFSCRSGICGTCMCRLETGEVSYEQEPTATVDPGSVLICIAKPGSSRVVLHL